MSDPSPFKIKVSIPWLKGKEIRVSIYHLLRVEVLDHCGADLKDPTEILLRQPDHRTDAGSDVGIALGRFVAHLVFYYKRIIRCGGGGEVVRATVSLSRGPEF